MDLYCEKCKRIIAQFQPETVSLPLKRDMFTGRHPSLPPPFRYVADDHRDFEDPTNWVCPLCRRWNPFVGSEVSKSDRTPPEKLFVGYDGATQVYFNFDVVAEIEESLPIYKCDKCPFETTHEPALKRHKTMKGH